MGKWYWIGMGLIVIAIMVGQSYSEYEKGQCKVEAIKAGKSAEDIAKICK